MSDTYHHGDLRRALLDEAARVIAESGPSNVSLRDLARRLNVSHAAPAHHFGDREGLMTALATEGVWLLAAELARASAAGFDEAAVAYVQFARTHPGHYAVIHRSDLLDTDDGELVSARAAAARELARGVESVPARQRRGLSREQAAQTAWALVHGLASLCAEGEIAPETLTQLTRAAARQLFSSDQ